MKITRNKGKIYNIEGAGIEYCCECRHKTDINVMGRLLPMCDINRQLLRRGSQRHRWCKRNQEDCERYNRDAELDGHMPNFSQCEFDDHDLDDDAGCCGAVNAETTNPGSRLSGDNLLFSARQISKTIKNQLAISDLKDGVIWLIHDNPFIAIKVIGNKLTIHKQEPR